MNNKQPLKFPSGEFTHTMLAQHNNATNQQVWVRYQEAIKSNVIVFIGERQLAGKGKPSKWWKLNDGTIATPFVKIEPKPVTEPIVKVATVKPKPTPTVKVTPPAVKPKQQPVVVLEEIRPIVQALTTADEEPEVFEPREVATVGGDGYKITDGPNPSKFNCPICDCQLITTVTQRGVWVKCHQPFEVCASTENPEGFGRSEAAAYTILCQKFSHR